MVNRRLEGWLFDVDELGEQVALWIYTDDGYLARLTDEFRPPVYARGQRFQLRSLASELDRRGIISGIRWSERREFWSGEMVTVLELQVADSSSMPKLRRIAAARDREFTFYNCDIPLVQYYLYTKKLFPLCRLACETGEAGNIFEIAATDAVWEPDYSVPEMRQLVMRGEKISTLSKNSAVILECSGEYARFRLEDGKRMIQSLSAFIERHDPDIILSERGDAAIFPALLKIARREKIDLTIGRDRVVTRRMTATEGRTYFSHGRASQKGASFLLSGRWHVDGNSSFIYRQTALDGIIELARLAKIPVQQMARTNPGSAIVSMEMDRAVADGVLVPWRKSEPENYKTALELLTVDKGGLVFQPKTGAYEKVAEIDFALMYPATVVRHNISPETVLCSCCNNTAVPEANYNICTKRRGLAPLTLEPLLERRRTYKRMMKQSKDAGIREKYDLRQTAIKWMLMRWSGYLGYKNARFGRIEAHEAVMAFGREKLLRAKELAEAQGYRVLHAITDSLWLKREDMAEADLLALCEMITEATEVEMNLEAIYNWIVFLPSKL